MDDSRYPVIILAGGKSTRLGRDKASEVVGGKSLLQRCVDACDGVAAHFVIVAAQKQQLPRVEASAALHTVEDAYPDTGPLGGICTGLESMDVAPGAAQHALVVACDMPLLQPALLRDLIRLAPGYEAVVPVLDGRPEPLCAVYSTACIVPARKLLQRGDYKLAAILGEVDSLLLPEAEWRAFDPEGLSFLNVNREEDLQQARTLIDHHEGDTAPQ